MLEISDLGSILYYLCGKNKDRDQLRLCFHLFKIMSSNDAAHIIFCYILLYSVDMETIW